MIPYSAGAHIGLQGGFAIADLPDLPGIVFLDSVADGQTVEDAAIVSQVSCAARSAETSKATIIGFGMGTLKHDDCAGSNAQVTSAWP